MESRVPPKATCNNCGAPDDGEAVFCRFCKQAYNAQVLASAIPCPHCRMQNRWGKQKCAQCHHWIVVACVFCGAISPHNQPACLRCGEGFQGAAERKAQRMQQQQAQQSMQLLGVVGNAAGGFLGAMAGVAAASSWHHSSYAHYEYDQNDHPPDGGSIFESNDGGSAFEWGFGGDDGGGFDFGGGDD
jgi:hypothetical protein